MRLGALLLAVVALSAVTPLFAQGASAALLSDGEVAGMEQVRSQPEVARSGPIGSARADSAAAARDGAAATRPAATLRVDGGRSTFMVVVAAEASVGYQITIDCIERCARPVHYEETTGDTPLGLFSRDQNDLIFSIWSGGSSYRVLVWSLAGNTVRKIAELSSRGRPDFMTVPDGAPVVQTYEGDSGTTALHRVRWVLANDRLQRFK